MKVKLTAYAVYHGDTSPCCKAARRTIKEATLGTMEEAEILAAAMLLTDGVPAVIVRIESWSRSKEELETCKA